MAAEGARRPRLPRRLGLRRGLRRQRLGARDGGAGRGHLRAVGEGLRRRVPVASGAGALLRDARTGAGGVLGRLSDP